MNRNCIIVRVLTKSDMGWFEVHRARTASKQRALTIDATIIYNLLSSEGIEAGGVEITAMCIFPGGEHTESRRLWKSGKNWRLGGAKLEGDAFLDVVEGDRCVLKFENHGITFTFLKGNDSLVAKKQSMPVYLPGSSEYQLLDKLFNGTDPLAFSFNSTREQTIVPVSDKIQEVAILLAEDEQADTGVQGKHAKHDTGFIYLVTLESRPGYVKIGKCVNPKSRLSSYQINDPLDGYTMVFAGLVYDYTLAERQALQTLRPWWVKGEWFEIDFEHALTVLHEIYTSEEFGIPEILDIELEQLEDVA